VTNKQTDRQKNHTFSSTAGVRPTIPTTWHGDRGGPYHFCTPCDDYEEGDVMISIIMNFGAQTSKISKRKLYSKWNIQL